MFEMCNNTFTEIFNKKFYSTFMNLNYKTDSRSIATIHLIQILMLTWDQSPQLQTF